MAKFVYLYLYQRQWRADGVPTVRRPRASTMGVSKGPVFV